VWSLSSILAPGTAQLAAGKEQPPAAIATRPAAGDVGRQTPFKDHRTTACDPPVLLSRPQHSSFLLPGPAPPLPLPAAQEEYRERQVKLQVKTQQCSPGGKVEPAEILRCVEGAGLTDKEDLAALPATGEGKKTSCKMKLKWLRSSLSWRSRHHGIRICYFWNSPTCCRNGEPCRSGVHGRLDSCCIDLPHCPAHPILHVPHVPLLQVRPRPVQARPALPRPPQGLGGAHWLLLIAVIHDGFLSLTRFDSIYCLNRRVPTSSSVISFETHDIAALSGRASILE
jgi:hypothetical protein